MAPGGVGSTLGGVTQTLPALYDLPPGDFNPVGGAGYNQVTGLGSPIARSLVPALAAWQPLSIAPATIPAATAGMSYRQSIVAGAEKAGVASLITTPSWVTYPAGLNISTSGSEVDLTGITSVAGTYTFTVTATDNNGFKVSQS